MKLGVLLMAVNTKKRATYTDNDNSVTLVFDAVNAPNEVKN